MQLYLLAIGLSGKHPTARNLNKIYEKICFIFDRRRNRHRVYHFLRTTAGNYCHFDYSGSRQSVADAIAGTKEGRR
jgi:hypothetical protein